MLFATLPCDNPNCWDIIATFASEGCLSVSPKWARKNGGKLHSFPLERPNGEVTMELIALQCGPNKQALGISLVQE